MTGEVEAAGEIATGALVARTVGGVDPSGGGNGQCLNCGTALIGSHCHACGQSGHIHRSLAEIWHDLAHGVLHVEGKIWRTLPLLIWRPGDLTRRYAAGERARFLSPLALFLFLIFLMFAVISALGADLAPPDANPDGRLRATGAIQEQIDEGTANLAALDIRRQAAIDADQPTGAIDTERAEARTAIQTLRATQAGFGVVSGEGFRGMTTGWARLDKGIAKANANPGLTLYKLQTSAYKFSWALIPLSVPFVWLLFLWRRGHHVYDHAVFVTYSLCFMTLLAIVLTIGGAMGLHDDIIRLAAVFAPPIHMYRQLRGTYRLGRRSALWRTLFLVSFAFTALLFFLLILLGFGLIG